MRRSQIVANGLAGRRVPAGREAVDHPNLLLRLEVGEFGGENAGSTRGGHRTYVGDGDRFESSVRSLQDLDNALLGLSLVQAKQRSQCGAADIGRLGRGEQALVKRDRRFGVARGGSGSCITESRLSDGGLERRVGLFGERANGLPGGLVSNFAQRGDGGLGDR